LIDHNGTSFGLLGKIDIHGFRLVPICVTVQTLMIYE